MRHPMLRLFAIAALTACLLPTAAPAYWGPSVVTLSDGDGVHVSPATCSDGEGGAIVAWYIRSGSGGRRYVARKVDAWGRPQWPAGAVQLSAVGFSESNAQIVADGAGGAIVAWACYSGDVMVYFAQRVDAAGTPLWGPGGIAVCGPMQIIYTNNLVADGSGGAYFTWEQIEIGEDERDVRVQHVDAAGTLLWDPQGLGIGSPAPDQTQTAAVGDGSGGVIVAWRDIRAPVSAIYAQAFDASGAARWTAGGVAMCATSAGHRDPRITSDGSGGAIVAWWADDGTGQQVHAQAVSAAGTRRWAAEGVLVGAGKYPEIASDGVGGAVLSYSDAYPLNGVMAQRLSSAGVQQWGTDGVRLCSGTLPLDPLSVVCDGTGGVIVSAADWSTTPDQMYLLWVDGDGTLQWDSTSHPMGIAMIGVLRNTAYDGGGGVIMAIGDGDMNAISTTTGRTATLTAAGPYTSFEGGPLTLAATAANWDGDSVVVEWDLNGDRLYDEVTFAAGEVPWEVIEALSPPIPVGVTREIHARATNPDGLNTWAYAQLTILPATLMPCFTVSATTVAPGQSLEADAGCSSSLDPEHPISLYEWYWDDQTQPVSSRIEIDLLAPYVPGTGAMDHELRLRIHSDNGQWAETSQVIHVVPLIAWCNLQWPSATSTSPGVPSILICGRVLINGLTSLPGATADLVAELGYGPVGSLPAQGGWTWQTGAYIRDYFDGEEYVAALTAASGQYDYAWRYRYHGGAWSFGDLDGSDNGYSPDQAGRLTVSGPTAVPGAAVTALRFLPAEPNPFNPQTTLRFALMAAATVRLEIYDVAGCRVRTLTDAPYPAGRHEARWDGRDDAGRDMPSGSYVARLAAGGHLLTTRLTLVR